MNQKCRVVINTQFGPPDVLKIVDREIPQLQSRDILVEGIAASVSTADIRLRSRNAPRGFKFIMGLIFGFRKPRYESLGTDYVGRVVDHGAQVNEVKVGDRIVADLGMSLNGYRTHRLFKPNKELWVKVPESVSSDLAVASIFGGLTALLYLRDKLKIVANERVLVTGAGGAVGSSAIQIAQFFGAEVVALCSANKAPVLGSLGVTQIFDYENLTWLSKVGLFDAVLDTAGVLDIKTARSILKPRGRIAFVIADLVLNLKCVWLSLVSAQTFLAGAIQGAHKDLNFLMDKILDGELKPVIGKTYDLDEIVKAHQDVETGHKLGSSLIIFKKE